MGLQHDAPQRREPADELLEPPGVQPGRRREGPRRAAGLPGPAEHDIPEHVEVGTLACLDWVVFDILLASDTFVTGVTSNLFV